MQIQSMSYQSIQILNYHRSLFWFDPVLKFANMYVPTTRTRITPRLDTSTVRTHTPTLGYRTLVPIPVCT